MDSGRGDEAPCVPGAGLCSSFSQKNRELKISVSVLQIGTPKLLDIKSFAEGRNNHVESQDSTHRSAGSHATPTSPQSTASRPEHTCVCACPRAHTHPCKGLPLPLHHKALHPDLSTRVPVPAREHAHIHAKAHAHSQTDCGDCN